MADFRGKGVTYAPSELENNNTDRTFDTPTMVRGMMYRTSGGWYYWDGTVVATNTEVEPTAVGNNKKTVTTAGTRVTLASSTTCKSVTIKALISNTGTIYVGDTTVSATNGFQLAAGDSVSLAIANLVTVNLDSSVNGEGVTYLYVA